MGTAGSGKTTLAILRSAYLADSHTDHSGKTLLVTFNKALVQYLKHLQERKLPGVQVENYHTFARGYLASRGKNMDRSICGPEERLGLIREALTNVAKTYEDHSFFSKPIEIFAQEIKWIEQQGIKTSADYKEAIRYGRGAVHIEKGFRSILFEIYEKYKELRSKAGKVYDWDDLASAVCDELKKDGTERRYKHIVIDEGQDFSPEMIRSLSLAIPPDGSLTFFGDVAQQIYGHRISWRSAGLKIKKIWEFKENYRNTRQIAKLGLEVSRMPYFKDTPDLVEPVQPRADGPLPTLVKCKDEKDEIALAVEQGIRISKTQSVAILLRDREVESTIRSLLPGSSVRLHRSMSLWQSGPCLYYGTFHSAKGLEFDAVIIPFCDKENLPSPNEIESFGIDEAATKDGRLLYVGITRARTRLIITYSAEPTELLPTDASLYERIKK